MEGVKEFYLRDLNFSVMLRETAVCVGGLTSSCPCASNERERDEMCPRGEVEEEDRKRKREGGIFISQHRRLGVCMFCPYSNGPDGTELRAEMKSSLMAHQRTDRREWAHGHNSSHCFYCWFSLTSLTDFCGCVCTNTAGLHVQLCVLEINHLFLFFIFDLLCFCSSDSQTSKGFCFHPPPSSLLPLSSLFNLPCSSWMSSVWCQGLQLIIYFLCRFIF